LSRRGHGDIMAAGKTPPKPSKPAAPKKPDKKENVGIGVGPVGIVADVERPPKITVTKPKKKK
jgi:hypothetical protein